MSTTTVYYYIDLQLTPENNKPGEYSIQLRVRPLKSIYYSKYKHQSTNFIKCVKDIFYIIKEGSIGFHNFLINIEITKTQPDKSKFLYDFECCDSLISNNANNTTLKEYKKFLEECISKSIRTYILDNLTIKEDKEE